MTEEDAEVSDGSVSNKSVVAMLARRFSTSAVISSTVKRLAVSLLSLFRFTDEITLIRLNVDPVEPLRPGRKAGRTEVGAGEYSCNESTRLSPVDSKGGRSGGWLPTGAPFSSCSADARFRPVTSG